ncbi:MAG: hypothetical protein HZA93_01650 [Verrucomicrobia bacterium]|nr:hypothetical protein [Verrucomicrobiota bacterium]
METPPLPLDQSPTRVAVAERARAFGFRLGAIYLVLHNLTAVLGLVPGLDALGDASGTAVKQAAAWIGHRILGITREIPTGLTGSSDTTADWLRVGIFATMAAMAAMAWIIGDRRCTPDVRMCRWLRFGLRLVLGSAMLVYGFMKIVPPTQFPPPSLHQLTQTLGESSPQGLLWKFMGFSPAYVVFLGVAEVMAGALLFFRRTTLLGALLTAGIMANVVMLNLCYDVPVKLYSGHLLVMAVFLIWPDRGRLALLLWFHRPTELDPAVETWPTLGQRRLATALTLVVAVGTLYQAIGGQLKAGADNAARYGATPPELRGIWRVEAYERDGQLVPPLTTDTQRWQTVIFGDYRIVAARRMDGTRAGFWFVRKAEAAGGYLFGTSASDATPTPVVISLPEAGRMLLEAKLNGAALKVTLQRVDERQFTLLSRGFHWITEQSFNR